MRMGAIGGILPKEILRTVWLGVNGWIWEKKGSRFGLRLVLSTRIEYVPFPPLLPFPLPSFLYPYILFPIFSHFAGFILIHLLPHLLPPHLLLHSLPPPTPLLPQPRITHRHLWPGRGDGLYSTLPHLWYEFIADGSRSSKFQALSRSRAHSHTSRSAETGLISRAEDAESRDKDELTALSDQACLFVYISQHVWIKAGVEFDMGNLWDGAVVCNPYSDW